VTVTKCISGVRNYIEPECINEITIEKFGVTRENNGLDCLDRPLSSAPASLDEHASSLGARVFLRGLRRSGGGDGDAGRTRAAVRV
jgi:hypothetical protein